MKVQIAKWGNSLGVRLPKQVTEEARLREGQTVEITARGGVVEVRPVSAVKRYKLSELVAGMERLGPENEPPREDWGILPAEWPQDDWQDLAPKDDNQ